VQNLPADFGPLIAIAYIAEHNLFGDHAFINSERALAVDTDRYRLGTINMFRSMLARALFFVPTAFLFIGERHHSSSSAAAQI
tara:strand:+ start:1108 stop:1356 length:249 start_codon:yes stop_codon:yes gene_type:complete